MKKFEMKKLAALAMVAVLTLAFAATSLAATKLTAAEAKKIALQRAGLKANQVRFTEVHKEYDDGHVVYDIEFKSGGREYSVEVDVNNGRIRDYDVDYDD